jgi:hypothetical protein
MTEIEHTVSERNILEKHNSPFLVSLKFSFQTPEKVLAQSVGTTGGLDKEWVAVLCIGLCLWGRALCPPSADGSIS